MKNILLFYHRPSHHKIIQRRNNCILTNGNVIHEFFLKVRGGYKQVFKPVVQSHYLLQRRNRHNGFSALALLRYLVRVFRNFESIWGRSQPPTLRNSDTIELECSVFLLIFSPIHPKQRTDLFFALNRRRAWYFTQLEGNFTNPSTSQKVGRIGQLLTQRLSEPSKPAFLARCVCACPWLRPTGFF